MVVGHDRVATTPGACDVGARWAGPLPIAPPTEAVRRCGGWCGGEQAREVDRLEAGRPVMVAERTAPPLPLHCVVRLIRVRLGNVRLVRV